MNHTILTATLLALTLSAHGALGDEEDIRAGERLARTQCAACHTVTPSTAKELPPSFFELAQSRATTEASLHFLLTHPHQSMPNWRLGPDEIAEIIAYILSLRP